MLPLKISGVMVVKTDLVEKNNYSSCIMRLELPSGTEQSWACYFFDDVKTKASKMKLKAGSLVQITGDLVQQPAKSDISLEQWNKAFPGRKMNSNPLIMIKIKEIDYAIPVSYTNHYKEEKKTVVPSVKGVFEE